MASGNFNSPLPQSSSSLCSWLICILCFCSLKFTPHFLTRHLATAELQCWHTLNSLLLCADKTTHPSRAWLSKNYQFEWVGVVVGMCRWLLFAQDVFSNELSRNKLVLVILTQWLRSKNAVIELHSCHTLIDSYTRIMYIHYFVECCKISDIWKTCHHTQNYDNRR